MSDFAQKLEEARNRLPLRRLMEQRGRVPSNGNWKSFPKCPYCQKDGAGIYAPKGGSQELFKCHHTSCPSGTAAKGGSWDEVGFLAYETGLSRRDAAIQYLKEAGVWQTERLAPSVLPGQRPRRKHLPSPGPTGAELPVAQPPEHHAGPSEPSAGRPEDEKPSTDGSLTAAGGVAVPGPTSMASPASPPQAGSGEAPFPDFPAAAGTAGVVSAAANGPDAPPPADGSGPPPEPPDNIIPLPGGDEDDKEAPPSVQALRWFYRRLHLSDTDRQALWVQRGLTAFTCFALGFRSNPKSNKELLLQMAELYPPAVLVDCGLWSDGRRAGDKPAPNPQFFGMSIVEKRDEQGRKVRDEDGDPITETVWNFPILIPYFDAAGKLFHLRPHKGMMRDKSPRFYVARPGAEALARYSLLAVALEQRVEGALITEGEFKAAALWQVLGAGRALEPQVNGAAHTGLMVVGSLPGITMAKPLFGDIEDWVADLPTRQVVIGYDNEEKGDPNLPGYTKEEWRRYDAAIWSRYLARQIEKEGYDAKVCLLPKSWRDERGKADWDGALARQIAALQKKIKAPDGAAAAVPGEDESDRWWRQLAGNVRADWLQVIQRAAVVKDLWQLGFFEAKEERIIKNGLERIAYEARLPSGGDHEAAIARRLQRLVTKLKGTRDWVSGPARGQIMMLAKKYQELNGRYYILKQLREPQMLKWTDLLSKANDINDTDVKRACEVVLRGIPEPITDFTMKAHYVLKHPNGKRSRLVTIHSVNGWHSPMLTLPPTEFTQPTKWRDWLHAHTQGASWEAGERELQRLHADTAREMAFMDVEAVPMRGCHAASRLWFFKDVTFTPDGKELREDRQGIIWFENQGYRLQDRDHEDQSLRHGEPLMHPDVKAESVINQWPAELRGDKKVGNELEATRVLFRTVSGRLLDTMGNYEAYICLGSVLAFGAGPEVFSTQSGLPSLWVNGEPRQGKSSVARWAMRIWGFNITVGIPLKDSTKVGMSVALQQYGCLPVWFEEYQPNPPEWMVEKLKNIYDRSSGSKKTFEEGDRSIQAGAIVTGVATSTDAQLRSRFVHVLVSAAHRQGNHFKWFQQESDHFYLLGRYVLRNRKEFADRVTAKIEEWLQAPELEGMDPRSRVVHGAAYAAFYALATMLNSHSETVLKDFQKFVHEYCRRSVSEVTDQINVNQLWREVLDAMPSDVFGATASERRRIFKVQEVLRAPSPVTERQRQLAEENSHLRHKSLRLFFRPGPMLDMLRAHKRKQNRELPLDLNDLRAQMQTRSYWVPGPHSGRHITRFEGAATPQSCWAIDLDRHDLGYQPVTDDVFEKSLYREGEIGGMAWPTAEWADPRRGDLYALVDSLVSNKEQQQGQL